MKKKDKPSISIILPEEKHTVGVPYSFYSFFTLFAFALGIYSSLLLMISSAALNYKIVLLLGLFSFFLTVLQKIKVLPVHFLASVLPYVLTLYLYRKRFFTQGNTFLHRLQILFQEEHLDASATTVKKMDLNFLFLAITYLFLLLLSLLLQYKKSFLFFVLLSLPVILNFFLGVSPSYFSIGCIIGACLFWYSTKPLALVLALGLYFICIRLFVPHFAPEVFKYNHAVHHTVNEWADNFSKNFLSQSQNSKNSSSKPFFSFEQESSNKQQTLSNRAPVYSQQTMFEITCKEKPSSPLYLRGFVGQDYNDAAWNAPALDSWDNFCKKNQLSDDDIQNFFSLPYTMGKEIAPEKITSLSLAPKFTQKFTYFPYGVKLSKNTIGDDTYAIKSKFSMPHKLSYYPLSLTSASLLSASESGVPKKYQSLNKNYGNYVRQKYLNDNSEIFSQLKTDLSGLPVYTEINDNPDFDTIQEAAKEIQNFLKSKASYSLSLAPVSSNSNFLYDFLYEQHKGFCVHFATTGTLLFRMYGIPARYVTGYVVQPEDFTKKNSTTFTCNVKDTSAHAWTEIYIENGIWVPVEVTPPSSANENANISANAPENTPENNTPNTEVPPPSENSETVKPDSQEKHTNSEAKKTSDTKTSKTNKPEKNNYLFIFKFLLGLCIIILLFVLRYQILYRKRIGYFVHSRTKSYFLLYQNLLKLWQTEFKIPEKNLAGYNWKQEFTKQLPDEKQNSFKALCNEAEEIYFANQKPTKKQIRTLRFTYRKSRNAFLRKLPKTKYFYYKFVKVL
ncbi:MAG: transglutaminase-like domain-containing protein [Bacillota bacterium]|nr:transglutaminase-like domain-containing protein [Bacillota bacterium]